MRVRKSKKERVTGVPKSKRNGRERVQRGQKGMERGGGGRERERERKGREQ
jgi:hypothetical protein